MEKRLNIDQVPEVDLRAPRPRMHLDGHRSTLPDRSNSKSCRQPNGPARTSNGHTNIFLKPTPIRKPIRHGSLFLKPKPMRQFYFLFLIDLVPTLCPTGHNTRPLPTVTSRYQIFFQRNISRGQDLPAKPKC